MVVAVRTGWNRIIATGVEGVAAPDAAHTEPSASQGAVAGDGFGSVV